MNRDLRLLMRYSLWANERLFNALALHPPAVVLAKRPTGSGSILETLGHAHVVDLIWKGHLEGQAHGFTSRQPDGSLALAALGKAQAAVDAWYGAYADGLSETGAAEIVHFKFVDGGAGAMSRGDMLLHIANHKSYHRGYVADMLYQAGLKPPVMDLPVFLRDAPPAL